MKYKAVIFDLFGTLVNSFPRPEYGTVLAEMSSLLSVPPDEFLRLWSGTSKQRFTGIFPSIEANIEHICRELKVQVTDALIKEVTKVRFIFAVRSMTLKPGGIEVISRLKSEGFRIALISNCAPETPIIWKDLPFAQLFDVTVFSCLVGLQKPDPRIYKLALEQLAVKPEGCLYIGDRAGDDLLGATSIGMHTVLIRDPEDGSTNVYNVYSVNENAEKWNGPVISSLLEVLALIRK